MDGEYRIEEIGKADAVGLGDQSEKSAIAIDTPWSALFGNLDVRLVMTIEQGIRYSPVWVLVGELHSFSPEPFKAYDRDQAVGQDAPEGSIGLKIFKSAYVSQLPKSAWIGNIRPRAFPEDSGCLADCDLTAEFFRWD